MFKKFSYGESVNGHSQVKSSVQRGIRAKILEQYPKLTPVIDTVMPKKTPLIQIKCHDRISLISMNNEVIFFNHYDTEFYPTLKLLHKYPDMMPKVQVDRGAIKFILSGANIMCPGLTSPGARMDEDLPAGTPVAVYCEGKEHAIAVGILKLSTEDIRKINKDIGIETVHYLNDGLWKSKSEY